MKRKQNCYVWFDKVRSMLKTRQENDVINHIGVVYAEIKIDLS